MSVIRISGTPSVTDALIARQLESQELREQMWKEEPPVDIFSPRPFNNSGGRIPDIAKAKVAIKEVFADFKIPPVISGRRAANLNNTEPYQEFWRRVKLAVELGHSVISISNYTKRSKTTICNHLSSSSA